MAKVRKVIIPVAGMGTRFLPATKVQPKEMLPIADKPVVHYLVEEAVESGIEEILFIINSNKHVIGDYFARDLDLENFLKERGKHDLLDQIKHIHDMAHFMYVHQDEPLGSGDAVMRGRSFINDEPFAVFYADDVMAYPEGKPALKQLIDVYEDKQAAVMGLVDVPKEYTYKYGVIDGEKEAERLYKVNNVVEKPEPAEAPSTLASVGRLVLTPDVFEHLENAPLIKKEVYLASALGTLAENGKMYGYEMDADWHDCGNKFGFWKANFEMGLENKIIKEEAQEYLKKYFEDNFNG
ncbi:MAG: UTP--glucose-1-phosphate uridylyltransferase [Candidatus Spechtbacterales bacterium]|nr:UTP--glucose-1-phosphate uridylyltransferase [Candidatus Spechtbacterales bacterium]